MKPMRAFIVDDSLLFREMLQQELERDVNVRVVGKAADAFEAGRTIVGAAPDVVIVDVFMERMDGLEFTRRLLPQYAVPVIIISADANQREAAEKIDTVVFLPKAAEGSPGDSMYHALLAKIRALANGEPFSEEKALRVGQRLIAIGASTGGAEAIERVLTSLPSTMPPIVISQHMPPRFTNTFANRLNQMCRLSVKEAEEGDVLIPGQVYIAPGGYHMSLRKRAGRYALSCVENNAGDPICPSVDVLFESVAQCAQGNALGVLLTGMGRDGAKGLMQIRKAGNQTIGQDEESSVVYGMPKTAFDMGAVELQLPLRKIPGRLSGWAWRA